VSEQTSEQLKVESCTTHELVGCYDCIQAAWQREHKTALAGNEFGRQSERPRQPQEHDEYRHTIEASFSSFCPECHEWIREGDPIVRSDDHDGRYVHEECK
jgi:hypothetical protein